MTEKSAYQISDLIERGLISGRDYDALEKVTKLYPLAITPTLLNLIDPTHPDDPIANQFIPKAEELITSGNELNDPIGDETHSPLRGVVHRYKDRILLKLLHSCPVYCRFCFRRDMVGPNGNGTLSQPEIEAALNYIRFHNEIWEIILTGGDPLMLSPRRLHEIITEINKIDHVKTIRFHTRVPLVAPHFINDELIEVLKSSSKVIICAIHANHKNEFSTHGQKALQKLHYTHIIMISQSVLLRGINDRVDTLVELMKCFIEHHIKPYYIHHPDKARGTGHFRISIAQGLELVNALRGHLSGLCQPHYMLDIPGGYGKVPLINAQPTTPGGKDYLFIDHNGLSHYYHDECL
jgi:lysine 2,3-aminomutase